MLPTFAVKIISAKTVGNKCEKYHLVCDNCHNKRIFNKGNKMSYEQYRKTFPDNMIFYNEQYFPDLEDLLEYLACNDLPAPDYIFGTSKERVEIDIEQAIQQAEEDSNLEDFYFENTKPLTYFVNLWNKENGVDAFYADYNTIIILSEEEKGGAI